MNKQPTIIKRIMIALSPDLYGRCHPATKRKDYYFLMYFFISKLYYFA